MCINAWLTAGVAAFGPTTSVELPTTVVEPAATTTQPATTVPPTAPTTATTVTSTTTIIPATTANDASVTATQQGAVVQTYLGYSLLFVSCAKTAELIKMMFGMWTGVGPRKNE